MADPITLPKKVLKSPQRVCPASEEGAVGQGIDHCVLAGLGASPQGWVQGGTFNGVPIRATYHVQVVRSAWRGLATRTLPACALLGLWQARVRRAIVVLATCASALIARRNRPATQRSLSQVRARAQFIARWRGQPALASNTFVGTFVGALCLRQSGRQDARQRFLASSYALTTRLGGCCFRSLQFPSARVQHCNCLATAVLHAARRALVVP